MSETVIVAIMSLFGTLIGTMGGIRTANKLVLYRIEQLERKVEKHNNLMERVYKIEGELQDAREDISIMRKEIKER